MSQQASSNGKSSDKKRPVHEIRLGRIRAAIWVNETENGIRHNITLSRLYRDEQQGQWKDSTSFGRDDLPLVAKVADQAHSWIYQAQARGRRPAKLVKTRQGLPAKNLQPCRLARDQAVTFPFDPLRDVPFSISCLECDCDSAGSYAQAIADGWTEITYVPNGMMENFFGYCPEHRPVEFELRQQEPKGQLPGEDSP